MMNIEFKVNGVLVGNIYLHNNGYASDSGDDCHYTWHSYNIDKDGAPCIREGCCTHDRTAGMFKLAEKICSSITEE